MDENLIFWLETFLSGGYNYKDVILDRHVDLKPGESEPGEAEDQASKED